MTLRCTTPGCGSYGINPGLHGRPDFTENIDNDLCDVCFWKKRAFIPGHQFNKGNFPTAATSLYCLLVAINAAEGCEHVDAMEPYLKALDTAPMELKNAIGQIDDYQTNEQLETLDAVFKAAGWDDTGLRWTREEGDDEDDIFYVAFTDPDHSRWEID
jgi:hypothetical protein